MRWLHAGHRGSALRGGLEIGVNESNINHLQDRKIAVGSLIVLKKRS